MNILITGGAGFIGSHLAKRLMKSHNIAIVDFKEKYKNISKLNVDFYGGDLSSCEFLKTLPVDFDIIVHCAAQTGGYYSLINPNKDAMWNCVGTANLVNYAKKCKNLKKIIYTSSMAVYGEGLKRKETDPTCPISFYGCSKLSAEYYVKALCNHTDINFTILRLWNTYGFGQDLENKHQGMLSIYLDQALRGKEIKVTGSKDRIRDFIHVSDVSSAINLCMFDNKADNEIFNVCSGIETSSKQIIREISNLLKKDLLITEIESYKGDQQISSGCNNKIKKLGWENKINLREGTKDFIQSILKRIN